MRPRSLKVLNILFDYGRYRSVAVDMADTSISPTARRPLITLLRSASAWIQNTTSSFEWTREFQISWVILDIVHRLGFFHILTLVIEECFPNSYIFERFPFQKICSYMLIGKHAHFYRI